MTETLPLRHLLAALLLAVPTLAAPLHVHAQDEPPAEPPPKPQERVEIPVADGSPTTLAVTYERMPLPTLSAGVHHPFTIEVPVGWRVRRDLPAPGVLLGPPSGDPNSHPEMVLVHESEVPLDDAEAILANLRANAAGADWSLRAAEVRDFGGAQGLWIVREMPPTGVHGDRVSYAVKLPLGPRSLDVAVTLPDDKDAELAPAVRHMLLSVRPADSESPGAGY